MKIAVYAIALNEAKHIERWVEATKDADYRLVADTGSTDGTPDMLARLGVDVYNISVKPWRFDVARNTALALVPDWVDVCLILDMDEVPEPGFFDKVREQWISTANRGWVGLNTGSTWAADRLHSRQGFVWKYACHEVAVPSMGTVVEHCVIDGALITHQPDNDKSRGQYLPMLEATVAENPNDPRMLAYLAREYYFHERWQEIIDTAEKLGRVPDGWHVERAATYRCRGYAHQQLGQLVDAEQWYVTGTEVAPEQPEAWFALAQFYYTQENWEKCWETADRGLAEKPDTHYLTEESTTWRLHDLAAIAAWNLGKKGTAKKHSRIALELNPTDERLKNNYAHIVGTTAKEYADGLS